MWRAGVATFAFWACSKTFCWRRVRLATFWGMNSLDSGFLTVCWLYAGMGAHCIYRTVALQHTFWLYRFLFASMYVICTYWTLHVSPSLCSAATYTTHHPAQQPRLYWHSLPCFRAFGSGTVKNNIAGKYRNDDILTVPPPLPRVFPGQYSPPARRWRDPRRADLHTTALLVSPRYATMLTWTSHCARWR